MAFNTEDKITLNDLAPSLQDLLIKAVKKSEITALQKRVCGTRCVNSPCIQIQVHGRREGGRRSHNPS